MQSINNKMLKIYKQVSVVEWVNNAQCCGYTKQQNINNTKYTIICDFSVLLTRYTLAFMIFFFFPTWIKAPASSVSLSSCLISTVIALSLSMDANSTSVVFAMQKFPKKSVGLIPVLVRTRRTESNPMGLWTLWFRSWMKRSPSLAA